ncbi:MAG: hypothetical protein AB7S39_13005 [Gemmatimonadales bacterium]
MAIPRRDFLERLAFGGVAAAGLDLGAATPAAGLDLAAARRPELAQQAWDLSWVNRITGDHRCVFDCTEIESGFGVLRALVWVAQYGQALGVRPGEMSPVVVIRHSAIPLAMNQAFWDRYGIGAAKSVRHPFTDEPTTKNPLLLEANELPPGFGTFNHAGLMAAGIPLLGCNLAFAECVRTVAKAEGVADDEARRRAVAMLLPGIILQPSGVFATIRAQEARCVYLKSS